MSAAEIDAAKKRLATKGVNPMDVKKDLAAHIVTLYHGAEAADRAADHFRQVVQEKSAPEEVQTVRVPAGSTPGTSWADLLVTLKLASSKSEVRRLIQQGGFYVEQEAVADQAAEWDGRPETLVRLGKRRYFKIVNG